MAASSSTLALAAALRALSDDELEAMLRSRTIRTVGVADWFDLAEALLDRASIQRALERLDRPTLALLAAAGELAGASATVTAADLARLTGSDDVDEIRSRADRGVALGLLGRESGRYAPWDAVVEQLSSWPSFGLPDADELIWTPPPAALVPVGDANRASVDRAAGERAFATTGRVTEAVLELRREPARRLAKGGTALPETRRLATAAGVDPDAVPDLLDLADRARLVAPDASYLAVTAEGVAWLDLPGDERWARLAEGWVERLPPELRELLVDRSAAVWDDGLSDWLAWYFPGEGDAIRERIAGAARAAGLLGITADATPSTPGRVLLVEGRDPAAHAMSGLFPSEVDHVYLQHDLSIVSPGPLAASLDARLRGMADPESRGIASTYRMNRASVTRALTAGEDADGILGFLRGISLSGLPQPIEYLVRDTAERFGSLRVSASAAAGARAVIRSREPALLAELRVDTALAPLGLEGTRDDILTSPVDAPVVYWSLVDARYPVVFEDAAGRLTSPERRPVPIPSDGPTADPVLDLVARLRGVRGEPGADGTMEGTSDGTAWIARQLELAVKSRTPVVVSVRMPDGSVADFRLEPASVAGGRLRARDPRAELERTLPLSSITAVTPLG